jgi:hypothetical protein
MRQRSIAFVVSCLFPVALLAASCAKDPPAGGAPTAATGNHATAGAKPGSHEDWCGEHAVPESQCTRCNKTLEAAFKATGDWCPDHGLPKSQCLKCNPDLKIVRPAKAQ